jgi:CheY-like chemotaxis protein
VSRLANILHVENDPIDVGNVRRALVRLDEPTSISTARNGKEALELLCGGGTQDAAPVSLVLLDLGMPIMGGLEFLEAVRAYETLRALPVVVLTSSDRDEERQRAYQLGVAGYFVKPLRFDRFVDVVDSILRYWSRSALP